MKNINKYKVKGFNTFVLQYGRDTELNMDRSKCIGSSDVGSIMGVNPYCSAYKLFLEKMGTITNCLDDKKKKRLAIGRMMEDFILACYLDVNEIDAVDIQRDARVIKEMFTAQADAIVNGTIIEIKNIDRFYDSYIKDGEIIIPEYYKYQMYWQMYLFNIKQAKLVVYNNSEQQLYQMDLYYPNNDVIQDMLEKVNVFKRAIETRNVDLIKPDTLEDMILLDSKPKGISYIPIKQFYDELISLNSQVKELDKRVEDCKNHIKLYMGEYDTLTKDDKPIITYKTQTSNRLDTDFVKNNYPEIYEKGIQVSKSRVFKFVAAK